MKNKKKLVNRAGWLISVLAVTYLIYRLATYDSYADLTSSLYQAGKNEWWWLVVAFLLIPVQLLAETFRWQWLLRGWKDISVREGWNQVLIGTIAGFITPYKIGDIPARLLSAGLDTEVEVMKTHGRAWLKDWRKWFPFIGWTLVRYVIWGVQLWGVLTFVGIYLTPWQAVSSIAVYYITISLMPSLPAAEVPLKGGWAVLIFSQFNNNVAAITLAVSIIWIFNTIIPVLFGSIEKIISTNNKK